MYIYYDLRLLFLLQSQIRQLDWLLRRKADGIKIAVRPNQCNVNLQIPSGCAKVHIRRFGKSYLNHED